MGRNIYNAARVAEEVASDTVWLIEWSYIAFDFAFGSIYKSSSNSAAFKEFVLMCRLE